MQPTVPRDASNGVRVPLKTGYKQAFISSLALDEETPTVVYLTLLPLVGVLVSPKVKKALFIIIGEGTVRF